MAVTEIKIKAEVILLVMSEVPVSKSEEDTLVIEMEQVLNKTTPISIGEGTNLVRIGTRFHFKGLSDE